MDSAGTILEESDGAEAIVDVGKAVSIGAVDGG